ncbi:hypothetical protein RN01_05185 [Cupriavidus sp. SHE]|uniref:DUF6884 domain-containing protein n=2 Tax=Bacteria TaxID=2 RepID=UPI00068E93A2|nr:MULTISPECIES: DUF6884 domain-containing protein [Cupriavidus]KWR85419.1 hypothetical protein RN01_05185 [Cupriavidus sp. SHE]GMG94624.1 hypothetical protein Cmtc_58440 [Cupriavidus sp. TKC]
MTALPAVPYSPDATLLLILACSGRKTATRARAIDLYHGVMYSTLRAHRKAEAMPAIVILSAEHGFISPEQMLDPYDRRMTPQRADEMLAGLAGFAAPGIWPDSIGSAFFAGGHEYRRVMRAILALLCPEAAAMARETFGAIGQQRAQLGAYLRGLGN